MRPSSQARDVWDDQSDIPRKFCRGAMRSRPRFKSGGCRAGGDRGETGFGAVRVLSTRTDAMDKMA